MFVTVYTITMTVGDVQVSLRFYRNLCTPLVSLPQVRSSQVRRRLLLKRLATSSSLSWHRRKIIALRKPNVSNDKKKFRPLPAVTSSVPSKDENSSQDSAPDSPLQKTVINGDSPTGNAAATLAAGKSSVNINWSPQQTGVWLQANRYGPYVHTLASYSGADLLRLTKDNLVQLIGLADGIRLYNALHARPVKPKLTLYVCVELRERVFQAIYISNSTASEFIAKVTSVLGLLASNVYSMYIEGPNGIKLMLTDQLVSHLQDHSAYYVTTVQEGPDRYQVLLTPSDGTTSC